MTEAQADALLLQGQAVLDSLQVVGVVVFLLLLVEAAGLSSRWFR